MSTAVLTLTLAMLTAVAPDAANSSRPKSSPYAPSLPYLTRDEEKKLDQIIDRFMLYDIGTLTGEEGRTALREFVRLGPEAIPALIRGLNRAAMIEHSCPVVVIGKKLDRLLVASDDKELLEFARDNIGAGVGRTRHKVVLSDLRVRCMLRKNALARRPTGKEKTPPGLKSPRIMTVAELAEAASSDRGPRLRLILTELSQRRGKEVLDGLCTGASSYDRDIQKLSRDLLDRHLVRQPMATVKEKLQDEQLEIRKSAIRVVAARMPKLGCDVIELLDDKEAEVRDLAHKTLVRFNRGEDLGPADDADKSQREEAQQKWRDWWKRRGRR